MKIEFTGFDNVDDKLSGSLIRNRHYVFALDLNTNHVMAQKVSGAQGQRKVRPILRSSKKFSFDIAVKLF